MLAPKNQKTFKIALVVLGMFLLLLAEPVLARKGGQKNSAPRGGNARSQQVRKTSPATAPRTRVVQRSQPARSKPTMGRTNRQSRGNFRRTSKPNVRQSQRPNSARPSIQTRGTAFNASKHAAGSFNAARHARGPFNATKHAQGSFNAAKHARGSFDAGKHSRGSFTAKRPIRPGSNSAGQGTVKLSKPKRADAVARPAKKVNRPKSSPERTTKPAKRIDSVKTARIAPPISKPKPAVAAVATVTGDRKPRIQSSRAAQTNMPTLGKPKRARIALKKDAKTKLPRKKIRLKSVDRIRTASRTKESAPQGRKRALDARVGGRTRNSIANNTTVIADSTESLRLNRQGRTGRRHRRAGRDSTTRYQDRQHRTRRVHRYEHVYRDRHNRICHRIVWPRYRFPVYYNWGSLFTFRYVYPYHHRRYVFVSLGGYWPAHYRYRRYYWYGYHPYDWYGYYPVAREVVGDTYNYYTYNYSYGESYAPSASYQSAEGVGVVDHTTFADVRERLAQQAVEPNAPTPADTYFEEAVKAFEEGDYNTAAEKFAEAIDLAPEDMVLPFAYAQALFANGQYSEAADALRSALENVSPEVEGVFYPRGLYTEDEVLLHQIDLLTKAAELYTSDADLQLLLGYQLLGIGEIDEVLEPLQQAGLDLENQDSATVLLNLLEKIKTEKPENADQDVSQVGPPQQEKGI